MAAGGPQAKVVLDVDYRRGAFELVLVNTGSDVARDIAVRFSRELIGARDVVVSRLPIFSQLRLLRAGKEVRVFMDSAGNVFRRGEENSFTATVTWQDDAGRHKAAYAHDLDAYRSLPEFVTDA
jgi:hypothetical protein